MQEVGVLDMRHALVLNKLRAAAVSLRLELLVSGDLASYPHKSSILNEFKADINVYGNSNDMATVGSLLSDAGMYLQEPEQLAPAANYRNPHVLSWEDQDVTPRFERALASVEASFENAVGRILDETKEAPSQTCLLQDPRISSILCR